MKRFCSSRLWKAAAKHVARLGASGACWFAHIQTGKPSLTSACSQLKKSGEGIQVVSHQLETRFLSISSALEKLAENGGNFVQLGDKLLNSATGRVGGSAMFDNAMRVIKTPLDFLGHSHANTRELLQRLKKTNDRIDEFINIQAELQRTIAPLKYIQTLFKIESAPLGEHVQIMFGALTLEIEQLHDQVCELFTTKFHELREVQRTVNEVINELQAQTDSLWAGISQEKKQIDKSLQQLQQELAENQKREPRISRVAKEINADIQQVVTGLQYQDIINQKLQHTSTALAQIEEHLGSEQGAAVLEQSCRLEAGQLQAVRQDIAGAEKAIKTGVESILGRLVNADSQCLTLAEFQQLTTSADGMVQVLFDVFDTLRKQITALATSSAAAFEKLRPIGGLASNLTVVVRDLSQRIHLIGLNAQVQAAQVDNGFALEVLSARTSEISRATTHISENVAQHLDQLVAGLADGVKELETLQTAALLQQNTLAIEGSTAERSLHALRDEALATLMDLDNLLENIRSGSEALTETIDFVVTADAPLAELQNELENTAAIAAHSIDPASDKPEALLQEFSNRYTMTAERKVFASVVNGQSHSPATETEHGAELFDDPALIFAVTPSPASKPPSVANDKRIASPEPPVNLAGQANFSASVVPTKPAAELGSNVELF